MRSGAAKRGTRRRLAWFRWNLHFRRPRFRGDDEDRESTRKDHALMPQGDEAGLRFLAVEPFPRQPVDAVEPFEQAGNDDLRGRLLLRQVAQRRRHLAGVAPAVVGPPGYE